jgi:hypothetical protein
MSYGATFLINGSTVYTIAEVLSLISAKAASSHTHAISDVTGLSSALSDLDSAIAGSVPTGAEIVSALDSQLGSTVWKSNTWGTIGGTLSSQTDLQTALNAKAESSHTHTLSQITDVTVDDDMVSITKGFRPGLYDDLDEPPVGTIIESSNDGHLYWVHRDGSVHLLCDSGGYGGVAWGAITGSLSDQTDLQTALNGKQPSSANLTSIASMTTSGHALIVLTAVGASIMATSEDALTMLTQTDFGDMRSVLGLEIGTNVQAHSSTLDTIALITPQPNQSFYFTDIHGGMSSFNISQHGRDLVSLSDSAAMRLHLDLAIGEDVQAYSSRLTTFETILVTPLAHADQAAVSGTAGGTYTATEQSLLNNVVTLLNRLRTELIAARIIKGSA